MSILQYPEAINAPNLQIYDNAAFDDADADASAIKVSWAPLQPISINQSEPPESDSSKENRSPAFCKSPVITKSPLPKKQIYQGKPLKLLFKQGLLHPPSAIEPEKIDGEIEEIEKEIQRLSSRLEALRIEKEGQDPKTNRRQSIGRIVPAKFMEQKAKKIEESPASFQRRGESLGPSEIASGGRSRQTGKQENRRKSCFWKLPEIEEEKTRSLSLSPKSRPSVKKITDPRQAISTVGSKKPVKRDASLQPKTLFTEEKAKKIEESPANLQRRGVSLGPSEIATAVRFRQKDRPENRRKSCLWKLPEIDEEKARKEKGRNLSLSPKSRPSVKKIADPRQGISTVGSKKPVKRDAASLSGLLQPKTLLFKERCTAASNSKNSRVVPSRYGQTPTRQSSENDKRKTRGNLSCSGKRKCDLPAEVKSESSPSAILKMAEELPRIRAVRCGSGSPRDSGPAKRVADLIGRKSYFDCEEEGEVEKSICQVLGFEEEEE